MQPVSGERRRRSGPRGADRGQDSAHDASQIRPATAMRARDVARPTEADLAAAEAEVVVVRRHWKPAE